METAEFIGRQYGTWTVVEAAGRRWLCRCVCGVERKVVRWDLSSGRSKNCGCQREKNLRPAQLAAATTHGMEGSPTYRTWIDMRRRCHDPRRPDYERYGARGITVCDEWRQSFEAFFRDMGPRPVGTTLDRLNNSGPYTKNNSVWASRKAQERNKRTNRIVEWQGRRVTLAEAIELSGLKAGTVHNRLNVLGWTLLRALTEPARS